MFTLDIVVGIEIYYHQDLDDKVYFAMDCADKNSEDENAKFINCNNRSIIIFPTKTKSINYVNNCPKNISMYAKKINDDEEPLIISQNPHYINVQQEHYITILREKIGKSYVSHFSIFQLLSLS